MANEFRIGVRVALPRITSLIRGDWARGAAQEIATTLRDKTIRNIRTDGATFENKWTPMAANTKYKRMVFGGGMKLLRGFEKYIQSKTSNTTATVFSDSKYVKMHHLGASGPWTITPKTKPFLMFPMKGGTGKMQSWQNFKTYSWFVGKLVRRTKESMPSRQIFPTMTQAKGIALEIANKWIRGTGGRGR